MTYERKVKFQNGNGKFQNSFRMGSFRWGINQWGVCMSECPSSYLVLCDVTWAPLPPSVICFVILADDSLQSTCEGEKKEEKWLYKGIRTWIRLALNIKNWFWWYDVTYPVGNIVYKTVNLREIHHCDWPIINNLHLSSYNVMINRNTIGRECCSVLFFYK